MPRPTDTALKWFSGQMKKKLAENDHKRHWSEMDDQYLVTRLLQEANELIDAIHKYNQGEATIYDIISECADVSNFSMFIATNKIANDPEVME
jgi:NTP pyrophosphatase (non-canonical NTP hydrolase)